MSKRIIHLLDYAKYCRNVNFPLAFKISSSFSWTYISEWEALLPYIFMHITFGIGMSGGGFSSAFFLLFYCCLFGIFEINIKSYGEICSEKKRKSVSIVISLGIGLGGSFSPAFFLPFYCCLFWNI